jgi:hypothetical protein
MILAGAFNDPKDEAMWLEDFLMLQTALRAYQR